MSDESGENVNLESMVNCFADENLNLLELLGMGENDVKRARKEKPKQKAKKKTSVPLSLVWKRVAGLQVTAENLLVDNGLASLRRLPSASFAQDDSWVLARMKGHVNSGQMEWTLKIVQDESGFPALAAGIEVNKHRTR
jgi:hypothetical protein